MSLEEVIPQRWDYAKIKEYCQVNKTNRKPKEEFPEEEFDYITVSCVDGEKGKINGVEKEVGKDAPSRAKREIHDGDVIVSTTRPYLRAFAEVPERLDGAICSTAFAVLTPKEEILSEYLWYAVRFEDFVNQLKKKQRGASYPAVGIRDVKESKIPVPPLEEQKMIIDKLEEIFDKIEGIKDIQEKIEKIEEQLRISIIGSELEEYENTEKIEEVISKIKGGSSADQYDIDRGYPVSRIETIADAEIDPNAVKYVDIDQEEYEKHVMKEGDILFSNINSPKHVGKTAIYDGEPEDLIHGMNLVLMRADEDKIIPGFLELSLTFEKDKGTFKNMCKQAVNQASLAQRDIKPIEITVPPLEDQRRIMDRISKTRSSVKEIFLNHKRTEEIIDELPNSILSEAFKGNLVDFQPDDTEDGEDESGEGKELEFDGEGQQTLKMS